MSRSYFPTTLIPRSFFPARIGDAMSLKDGTEVTVGSDRKNISTFFWLTDKKTKARVSLYFNHKGEFHPGYLGMYDISYGDAWSGDGEELLKKIRSLVRGKFEPRYPEKGRAKKS